jgi:hypothetical protein
MVGIHVEGEGILADLYRGVADTFQPLGVKMAVDNAACLPNPIPPDTGFYLQIGTLTNSLHNKEKFLWQ